MLYESNSGSVHNYSQCTGRQCNVQSKPEVNLLCQIHGISSWHLLDNLSDEEEWKECFYRIWQQ